MRRRYRVEAPKTLKGKVARGTNLSPQWGKVWGRGHAPKQKNGSTIRGTVGVSNH